MAQRGSICYMGTEGVARVSSDLEGIRSSGGFKTPTLLPKQALTVFWVLGKLSVLSESPYLTNESKLLSQRFSH